MAKRDGANMSFIEHLEALRWHLVRAGNCRLVGVYHCAIHKHRVDF